MVLAWLALAVSLAFAPASEWPAFVAAEVSYDPAFAGEQAALRTVDVYVPEGEGPFPLVVWAHGGGFVNVAQDKGYNVAEFLQGHGFVVALVGYRLSPRVPASPHDVAMADYLAALSYVVERSEVYRVDPDRIVLAGHSSGGGLATRAAVNPYWLGTVGLSQDQIELCVPVDQAGWNLERTIDRTRNSASGSVEAIFGVTRDNVPEPGFESVGKTVNAVVYPIGTSLYDHPTVLYPDLQGTRHPRNLSVLYDIDEATPRHWIPYSRLSADRTDATAEFTAAMAEHGREAAALEISGLDHGQMKSSIGRFDSAEATLLSNGLLAALGAEPVSAAAPVRPSTRLAVSPNPATGTVRVEPGRWDQARVEVTDLLGRRVATLADGPVRGPLLWPTAGVPAGLYRIRVVTPRGVEATSVTVAR